MKVHELRIGNMVVQKVLPKTMIKISSLSFNGWVKSTEDKPLLYKVNEIEGIPIDKEYLLRLGFRIVETMAYKKDKLYLYKSDNNDWIYLHPFHPTKIKYVHQLQNLYFELIGRELTLKQQ